VRCEALPPSHLTRGSSSKPAHSAEAAAVVGATTATHTYVHASMLEFVCPEDAVARSQTKMSANFGEKKIRPNETKFCSLSKICFTATNYKISIKISCFEIYIRKSFDENCLQKPINHGQIHIFHTIFFSAGFRPLFSQIGGRTAAKFPRPNIFLFGRFCVILQNFRPAGNSDNRPFSGLLLPTLPNNCARLHEPPHISQRHFLALGIDSCMLE
jgi:hypothetical protein